MNYLHRIEKLRLNIAHLGCDALIVDSKVDLLYFTGMELSAGKLLVDKQRAVLFVDNRYFEMCQKLTYLSVEMLTSQSFENYFKNFSIKRLGFDSSKTSYKEFQQLSDKRSADQIELVPLNSPIDALRLIKDNDELDILREAAFLGSLGYDFVCSLLKEGVSEEELACELEIFWRKRGSKGLAFSPIIAFGANSSMPHYRAGTARLKSGDTVLIDIGVNYKHYHSDMTRVVFFESAPPQLLAIHNIVREAQRKALALCRPGTTLGMLDRAARDYISAQGFGERFTHSLGHGVGLDIHEFPTIRNLPPYDAIKLEPGMVLTIEPGIYLPGLGGVRIEDTVAITSTGYENLTNRNVDPLIIHDV